MALWLSIFAPLFRRILRTMSEPPILNFPVYLNYLPPDAGAQYEVMRNVHVATLGAYIWDMLSTTAQEVKMLRARSITVSMFAYWLTRSLTLVVLVLCVLFRTGPIYNCQGLNRAVNGISVITVAASTFLFLKRVQAVFFDNKAVSWSISALWLANVVVAGLVPLGLRGNEIADTKHCAVTGEPPYLVASTITYLIYDSLVFLVISAKIAMSYTVNWRPTTWRIFLSRSSSSCLSQSILRGGQQYYLSVSTFNDHHCYTDWIKPSASVCVNVASVILFFTPAVPPAYRTISMLPAMVLTNSMACRVFRDLFLKDIQPGGDTKDDAPAIFTTTVQCQIGGGSRETKTNVSREDAWGKPRVIP
ncbi:hypothetical protein F5I97DRAFT_1404136 [Phlebopus sp. FC_14]|nr:hypothetical protein F5I97DRAFT_1404136 [Phlebopus sp. FC_14]